MPAVLRSSGPIGAAELALSLVVFAVVGMMILPLPTPLLDVLIAANLSLSVAVLLVVLYAKDALSIATFPTLLLLTTLYRLALNVSSTRLILLQGDAGEVIRAFGNFVVRGNYVVGAVVFLILTLIQFIVIAKGSERVAEVGARFVLDAMPGKQMAIDAELRAGSIDGQEARKRRRALSRESQFYGAMDGAMKFVKGDVIASLIITIINVAGGLAIGVGQRGMAPVEALKRYGLLTIGDGLVSQIPALVLSTAAGVLVTRTASEDPDTPLGQELATHLFGAPKALRVASAFVAALAIVPGLPALPFLVMAGLLFVASRPRKPKAMPVADSTRPVETGAFVPMLTPLTFEVSPDLIPHLEAKGTREAPGGLDRINALPGWLFHALGVPLSPPKVRAVAGLSEATCVISMHEVPAQVVHVPAGDEALGSVITAAETLLMARAHELLGLSETQRLLDELELHAPATVRNVVPKPLPLATLADVLRRLVEERVSVRDLRAILEGLAAVAATEKDPLALAELARAQLRRPISFNLTAGASVLSVITVDPIIEDTVRKAITRTPAGSFLSLPPAPARDVIASLKRAAAEAGANGHVPIVLTQPDIRRFLRKLIETDVPAATVVSFAELLPELTLRPVAKATLAGLG